MNRIYRPETDGTDVGHVPMWVLRRYGPQGAAVYAYLSVHYDQPVTIADMQTWARVSRPTIRRHLSLMADEGAIERRPMPVVGSGHRYRVSWDQPDTLCD